MSTVVCSPLDLLLEDYSGLTGEDADADYDIHYDQRQSGTENYRLKVDGVVIAAPAGSEDAIGSFGLIATNYMANLAAATSDLDNQKDSDENKPYAYETSDHQKEETPSHQPETETKLADLDSWQFKNGPQPPNKAQTIPEQSQGERLQLRSKSNGPSKKRNK